MFRGDPSSKKCYRLSICNAWPSQLYGAVGGGPHDFSVSPSPLQTNWVLELGWTGLGMGLWGLGTKGLVTGLDNKRVSMTTR